MNINRRGFAKLLLGGAVSIAATPLLKLAAIAKSFKHKAHSSFGWIDKGKIKNVSYGWVRDKVHCGSSSYATREYRDKLRKDIRAALHGELN